MKYWQAIDRLAVEDADAPVELGVHEFLRDQQRGVLEQLVGGVRQRFASRP
jgi:hypothetical protein